MGLLHQVTSRVCSGARQGSQLRYNILSTKKLFPFSHPPLNPFAQPPLLQRNLPLCSSTLLTPSLLLSFPGSPPRLQPPLLQPQISSLTHMEGQRCGM